MRTVPCLLALVLTLAVSAAPTFANHDHAGNQRVVQLAGALAQQAQYMANQSAAMVGWGGNWTDQAAVQSLRQFSAYTVQLYQRAYQLENGVGARHHDDEEIGHQLEQMFYGVWQQATNVERYLYASYRLRPLRGYWDYQLCGTLRTLKYALNAAPRDARREDTFARLTGR